MDTLATAAPHLSAKFGGTMARLAGPKGLTLGPNNSLIVADTESEAIRQIDLGSGIIKTILGTGALGDCETEKGPPQCELNRPHTVLFAGGVLYVGDSEAHRILVVK